MALSFVLNLYSLLFLVILFKISDSVLFSSGVLYSVTDPIVILNSTSLKATIHNKSNVWLVQFYNSWCGHCVRFAPTWKELAQDIIAWKQFVNIGVIDCNERNNYASCHDYEVIAFPTIKFFSIFSPEGDHGTYYTGEMGIQSIRESIINHLEAINQRPASWPNFQSCRLTSSSSIWTARLPNVKYVFLIFESKTSYLAREVIFDTHNMAKVQVLRVNLYNHDLIKELGISNFPAFFLIENGQVHEIKLDTHSRTNCVNEIRRWEQEGFASELLEVAAQAKETDVQGDKKSDTSHSSIPTSLDKVYMVDLESALLHSLQQEVALRKIISGNHLETVKAYVSVLVKFFPGRENVMSFLRNINDWLLQQEENISSESLLATISHFQTSANFLSNTWIGCRGSQPRFRGYPCGIWMIFHSLTVQHSNSSDKGDPLQVLHAMLAYIMHFFGCDECAHNFVVESATMDSFINSSNDAVLWLWSTHNQVNFRLAGDITEDPEHPKRQFPSRELCNSCYVANSNHNSKWNLSEVLSFLQTFYSKININMEGLEKASSNENEYIFKNMGINFFKKWRQKNYTSFKNPVFNYTKLNRFARDVFGPQNNIEVKQNEFDVHHRKIPTSGSWFFSSIDISLCVVLYILSSIILLFVYYLVANRKKKKKYPVSYG